jgi:hypothetical protein
MVFNEIQAVYEVQNNSSEHAVKEAVLNNENNQPFSSEFRPTVIQGGGALSRVTGKLTEIFAVAFRCSAMCPSLLLCNIL